MFTYNFSTKLLVPYLFLVTFNFIVPKLVQASEIQPTSLMQQETKWLVQALQQAHFNKVSVKNLNPTDFVTSYLSKLDKSKLYFTQTDVTEFINRYSPTLVTFFEQGNLFPGFEIYNFYKTKSIKRLDWVMEFVESDFSFDSNNSYKFDREDADWETNNEGLDGLWKRLIEFEILGEVLSSIETNSTNTEFSKSEMEKLSSDSKVKVRKRYERWKKSILEFESTDVQELYLSTLTQMFDPHTTFMNIKRKRKV